MFKKSIDLRKRATALVSICLLMFSHLSSANTAPQQEYYQYEPFTLAFTGPNASELGQINPFMDYRLDVTFTQQDKVFVVPGYFAADGNAAETSAVRGNQWQVKFAAESPGAWQYRVSFKQGKNIAVAKTITGASAIVGIDGLQGTIIVKEKRQGPYAKGRLEYVGEHYLKFSGSGKYFIKAGVDSPENLLAYADFDATPDVAKRRKNWHAHRRDYNNDAASLLWQGEKGKSLFGAINYLAEKGLNAFSFLTFNVDGDDRNVFPHLLNVDDASYQAYANKTKNDQAWSKYFHKTRFDVSKLAQWERVFTYGSQKGFFLHFKTHERETDHLMDNAALGHEQKLYYREIIARFAHHPSLNWNLGEENNIPQALQQKIVAYIRATSPYKKQHIVMHTAPHEDHTYAGLVGDQSLLTGASIQGQRPDFRDVYTRIIRWYHASAQAGKPWALAIDEAGSGAWGLVTDAENPSHNEARIRVIWGGLLAGAWGIEWYFGYKSPHNDIEANDYRSRDLFWQQNTIAREFFEQHVAVEKMRPLPQSLPLKSLYVFGIPDQHYLVMVENPIRFNQVKLDTQGKKFQIQWFNTREGGDLVTGTMSHIIATEQPVALGLPPSDIGSDWLAILKVIN
ncbi:MAG: DUF5060 domain-containing protein [Thalassotalea sp.]